MLGGVLIHPLRVEPAYSALDDRLRVVARAFEVDIWTFNRRCRLL